MEKSKAKDYSKILMLVDLVVIAGLVFLGVLEKYFGYFVGPLVIWGGSYLVVILTLKTKDKSMIATQFAQWTMIKLLLILLILFGLTLGIEKEERFKFMLVNGIVYLQFLVYEVWILVKSLK